MASQIEHEAQSLVYGPHLVWANQFLGGHRAVLQQVEDGGRDGGVTAKRRPREASTMRYAYQARIASAQPIAR
jgi:hypothetical protein